ncbi:hypothetical protein F383_16673 [Gossypium arboreum]|uniref:Uncharacterized protein n=1 Tax=Gossypium arboreum TaxID=29729 RepID=A0A0B0NFP3_GOSAR|nr:hypothetical protein F383_16673 [Gossypium arboreum]
MYPIVFQVSTGSLKRSSMGNLDKYVKDEKLSIMCKLVQCHQVSSGIGGRWSF